MPKIKVEVEIEIDAEEFEDGGAYVDYTGEALLEELKTDFYFGS